MRRITDTKISQSPAKSTKPPAPGNEATREPSTLAEQLRQQGRLSVKECLELFVPLTEALNSLHQQNRVHGNINTSNIFLSKGVPRLAEITSAPKGMEADTEITSRDTEPGTPPEDRGTPAADIYSLGLVLYQAVTGLEPGQFPELPHEVQQGDDVLHFIQLNKIILKACKKDAAKRYSSATQMLDDLLQLRKRLRRESRPWEDGIT